jgi:hypothetical protein
MTSEALPKYMLLHEDSEEMRDKRICTIKGYLEVGDGVQRTTTKRINNTIPLTDTLYSTGIYNLGKDDNIQPTRIPTDCSSSPTRKE